MKLAPELYTALSILEEKGYEAFLVGGAVRDLLLNRENADYDITTNADPNAIMMAFSAYRTYDTGKKHGTVTILIDNIKIEITPYRHEESYSDHRHPEVVEFTTSLESDLQRRDFTINALCLDKDGKVIDLFNGVEDLNEGIIRAIGDPDARFNEDALRIMRAMRFKSKLGFRIEEKTEKALFDNAHLLGFISPERKREELLQILSCPSGFEVIKKYFDIIHRYCLPVGMPDRLTNDFSDPLFALADLLRHSENIDLKEYKYSNMENELVSDLVHCSRIDIEDDLAFIETLSGHFQDEKLAFLQEFHHLDLKERFEKLHSYMITVNELALDGKALSAYGISGKKIGQTKKMLTELVHRQKIDNSPDSLSEYLKKNII